ncbi:2,3-bisphosphoglycerate-independent phosphoglycerate mutase [Adlercreutzia sp. ZJ138]|uniref:2,3-bisphosphoglycerate-independent phosphoglycerate mutase n=1 Tax=Adlercreutzia sp. ZJ138 TaxID=2709405 RepID=UPI0013EB1FB3|nr:2,3-bisphosphoglycerate-independent phosphoglycerate mutase [Adlercreutzia sp. ZJ138]
MSSLQAKDAAPLAPACLIIMDGFGLAQPGPGNAISRAATPCLDKLFAAPGAFMKLEASGAAVGLPDGQMGNSEVGHLNIGAGRVVFQELTRINNACANGSLARNGVLAAAFEAARKPGAALHLMGLLSDGGVHSSNAHLYALLRAARDAGVGHVMVHCFMDGRDVPPKSGKGYMEELVREIHAIAAEGTGAGADESASEGAAASAAPACKLEIASVSGRYYAMDRDNRWERVERAWRAIVEAIPLANVASVGDAPDASASAVTDAATAPEARAAEGRATPAPAVTAMVASYDAGITDEFVEPVALSSRGVQDGDAVVFFNFRPDRARELTRAIVDPEFSGFTRTSTPQVEFVCLTEYDPEIPAPVAFAKEFPADVLADVLAREGLRQYHIAETEKYAHVTFFLNGGIEEPKQREQRSLIASPKVATYDLQPEMSEPEVANTLAAAIDADEADVYIVNFANCDMVGHTGVIPAAVAAVEAVDAGVAKVLAAIERAGGVALVTADHGNADKMLADDGSPHTAHTTALVPLALADFTGRGRSLRGGVGALCDIAPTLLNLIGVEAPAAMTGTSLIA